MQRIVWVVVLVGCAPTESDQTAYLLVDDAAREGVTLQVDGVAIDARTPFAVQVDQRVQLFTADTAEDVWLEAGALHLVQGAEARVRDWWIDVDISGREVVVLADEETALDLAYALYAELEEDGPGWRMTVDDLYPALAALDVPEGVQWVMPTSDLGLAGTAVSRESLDFDAPAPSPLAVALGIAEPTVSVTHRSARASQQRLAHTFAAEPVSASQIATPSVGDPAAVGIFCRLQRCVTLDVMGVATTCRDESCAEGVWSSHGGDVLVHTDQQASFRLLAEGLSQSTQSLSLIRQEGDRHDP